MGVGHSSVKGAPMSIYGCCEQIANGKEDNNFDASRPAGQYKNLDHYNNMVLTFLPVRIVKNQSSRCVHGRVIFLFRGNTARKIGTCPNIGVKTHEGTGQEL